jgi:hypothetical protein
MNKFLISWVVVFVAWMAGSFAIHGTWLAPEYAALPAMFRPEADAGNYLMYMLAAHVIMSGAFVWIYQRGVSSAPWVGQAIRFGIAIALLGAVGTYMIYYAVQPMPGSLVVKQMIGDSALVLVLSLIVAGLNKPSVTV